MSDLPIRRNTALLSLGMAVNSATFQLVAAISSLTFVLVTGIEGLLGLGPAIFMVAGAGGSLVAGRLMDRLGRIPVLACGFLSAACGAALTALGTHLSTAAAVVPGFALLGVGSATVALSRAAGGDMYPPERRARGIAYVLFGSVFGAILGPAVFSPIFRGRELEAAALTTPWLVAVAIALVGGAIVLFVRPDPKQIAELLAARAAGTDRVEPEPPAPLAQILRRPGVVPAMVAGVASFAVMVAVMNLTGYVVVEHRHHAQHLIFPIIGAHVAGMFLLTPVVGAIVDRIGRPPALAAGLGLIAVSTAGMTWLGDVWSTAALLFGLGLGWNVSFVAATAQLADLAAPSERGRLLGFNDLVAGLAGASLVLLGGYALDELGVAALSLGAALLALAPVVFFIAHGRVAPPVPETP